MKTGENNTPGYRKLLDHGELGRRAEQAMICLERCALCGRRCQIDRRESTRGAACRTGAKARVNSYGPHFGEEDPLRGWAGSGTIFFSSCNLRCVYCQNWEISQKGAGREVEDEELAAMMLELQEQGCHNINLVSPSHVIPQILAALQIAATNGLELPLVYNTGGYDSPEGLELLEGIVDVYMPDMKYGDSAEARHYSRVRNYASINRKALLEMHRQVGDLTIDERGLCFRGLLVRHLVLPGGLANTGKVLKFLSQQISTDTYLNLMDQYRPSYRAWDYPPLDRAVTDSEYRRAVSLARKYGLHRLDRRRAPALPH